MALPPKIRYFLARLSPLAQPAVLSSGLFVVLLGVSVWQYRTNPEWFGAYAPDDLGPNAGLDTGELTPEEQAAIADIDTLSVLLNGDGTAVNPLEEEALNPEEASLLGLLSSPTTPEEENASESTVNSLSQYLEKYRFIGQGAQPSDQGATLPPAFDGTAASSINGSSLGLFNSLITPPSSSSTVGNGGTSDSTNTTLLSPLEAALQLQQSALGITGATAQGSRSGTETSENAESTEASEPSGTTTFPNGVSTVTIPGVAYPVLQTSPQMSPPPGTTGYTAPPTLNLLPSTAPSSGNIYPTLIPGTGRSLVPASNNLNLNLPNVDVSAGSAQPTVSPLSPVLPSTGVGSDSPFAVPRPPGSYTGGGYIYTFSNPSAPYGY